MASEIFRPATDVVSRQLGESAVVIHLATNRIYELNPTGARLWTLIGDGATVGAALDTLAEEFEAPPDTIRTEVEALVQELLAEGLLVSA